MHDEADLGAPLGAHLAGHAHAPEDARRRRGGADGTALANVVGAMRLRSAAEVVALDRAREALADGRAGHFHGIAGLEGLDRDRLTHRQLRLPAKLDEPAVRRDPCLLEMAE